MNIINNDFVQKNRKVFTVIAVVFMFITAFASLVYMLRQIGMVFGMMGSWYYGFGDYLRVFVFFICNLITAAGFGLTAGTLISPKFFPFVKYTPLLISASYVIAFVGGIGYSYITYFITDSFVLLGSAAVWALFALPMHDKLKETFKIDRGILVIVAAAVSMLALIVHLCFSPTFMSVVLLVVEYGALVLFGLSMTGVDEKGEAIFMQNNERQFNRENHNENYAAKEPEGFINIWMVILLSMVTCGIYTIFWAYKTMETLNKKLPESEAVNTGIQLLLYLFVPFYIFYWIYKQGKRVEAYSRNVGNNGNDLAVLGLVVSIFGFALIAYALIQDQINKNIMAEGKILNKQVNKVEPNQEEKRPEVHEEVPKAEDSQREPDITLPDKEEVKGKEFISREQYESLKRLKELLDLGIITEDEFKQKKQDIF